MSKSMLINVILEEESRVAIVDNGVLDFFEIETLTKGTLKGNIYKGVVDNVNGSLEAAWVDCGWDKPGFLPLDEVNFKVLPTLKSRRGNSKIQEHVAPGMEVIVQVFRDKLDNKPPSLTTYYSLPGRYLVLMPHADASGVSRRIPDDKNRAMLKTLMEELQPPDGYGMIVRTAGLGQSRNEMARDLGYLIHLWETIAKAAAGVKAPTLIYRERGLALRTIRDQFTDDIQEVLIDDQAVYESAIRFIRAIAPNQEQRVQLYSGDRPLFTKFNLEEQIETIYKRRVPLKSGGDIVIQTTEAMTTIDVNSSKGRESSVEELAYRTNLEAATEVPRQLRLRDIGGLIVVDFIDMEKAAHVRAVEKAMLAGMASDKAKFDATKISKLGMMEISRQRLKAAKSTATYETCAACDGVGKVRTTEAAAMAALRRIQTRVVRGDIQALTVTAPSDVALYLSNRQRDELLALETRYHVKIALIPRPDFPKERCDLEVTGREGPAPPISPALTRSGRETHAAKDARGGFGIRAIPESQPPRTPRPAAPAIEERANDLSASRIQFATPVEKLDAARGQESAVEPAATSPISVPVPAPITTLTPEPAPLPGFAGPSFEEAPSDLATEMEPAGASATAAALWGARPDHDDTDRAGPIDAASTAETDRDEEEDADDPAAAAGDSDAAGHKRRRRRGGRGRGRKTRLPGSAPSAPSAPSATSAKSAPGASSGTGDSGTQAPRATAPPLAPSAGGIVWELDDSGASGAGVPGGAVSGTVANATGDSGGTGAGAPKKRRRRSHDRPRKERAPRVRQAGDRSKSRAKADAASDRPPRTATDPHKSPVLSHQESGDEVPGGWWSRLVGNPKKPGDRED